MYRRDLLELAQLDEWDRMGYVQISNNIMDIFCYL